MKFFPFIFLLFCLSHLALAQLSNDSFTLTNSGYDELNPLITPDGKLLFVTIANHPQNMGGKKDPGDIWVSVLAGNAWTAPVHAGPVINDNAYNAVAGISSDGMQLFLLSHYDGAGKTAKSQGISVSRNTGSGWSKPVNISIPYFQNKSNIVSGFITPDQGVFVFSAETYGTHGVEDIYITFNEDGRWTEPKNLGAKINTQFQELCPSLSSNGKTLYFSSNGRKGFGSFDVYASTRLDETWTNWSDPVNLGADVNTEGRELFFNSYNSDGFALYCSTKNSDGYGDIRMYKADNLLIKKDSALVTVVEKKDTVIKISENTYLKNDDKLVTVHGKVTNTKTGEPINAVLLFSSPALNSSTTAAANGFSIQVPSTDVYTIKIEANGYVSAIENLDIHTFQMKELEMNFKLQPVEIGTVVNLKNVLFERGTSTLLPESNPELDLVVSFLKANPSIKIELGGHTDSRGVHADNVKLSLERVNKVKEYLVQNGVDAKRINGKGYGGLKPIASNDAEDTRKLNRRVEFTIKKF